MKVSLMNNNHDDTSWSLLPEAVMVLLALTNTNNNREEEENDNSHSMIKLSLSTNKLTNDNCEIITLCSGYSWKNQSAHAHSIIVSVLHATINDVLLQSNKNKNNVNIIEFLSNENLHYYLHANQIAHQTMN